MNRGNTHRRLSECVLALLAAAALGGAAGTGGCPTPSGPIATAGIGGASDYVGADVCRGCHRSTYETWAVSPHAGAFDTLRGVSQQGNRECLSCHVTAYAVGGFVSETTTPKFAGVQCEGCHGPGARHVGTRNPRDILRAPGTAICARCHTGPAQPNHEEWLESAHARALITLRADPAAQDDCLSCHSYDYMAVRRRNDVRALRGLAPDPLPSIADMDATNDPTEGVGCASCHAPHGSDSPAELRAGISATCGDCHSDQTLTPGTLPHAPQLNMVNGVGGRRPAALAGAASDPLVGVRAIHGAIESLGACAKCHGANRIVASPTREAPNRTGHRFDVEFTSCLPCHDETNAATLTANLEQEVEQRLAALRNLIAARNVSILTQLDRQRLVAATLNLDLVERDGSGGAHNPAYGRALLDAAEALVNQVQPVP